MLISLFKLLFLFPFILFRSRVMVRVTSLSHCHTSVTVMVTSHNVTEKNIEGSRKIILYNMCNIWSFSVG